MNKDLKDYTLDELVKVAKQFREEQAKNAEKGYPVLPIVIVDGCNLGFTVEAMVQRIKELDGKL